MTTKKLPIAVIGAGPIGLAAAAQLLQRGLEPIVLEAGSEIAANIRDWGHVRLFSPWRYLMEPAGQELLSHEAEWQEPQLDHLPTGHELIDEYLLPLANSPRLSPHIRLNTRVTAVTRRRIDKMKSAGREGAPFVLRVETPDGENELLAAAVIDASGTWHKPNPAGADGLRAMGELENQVHIHYGIPDVLGSQRASFEGKEVAVAGGGHSAINAILELSQLAGTRIRWILRKPAVEMAYGGLDDDELEGRGLLGKRIKAMVDAGQISVHTPFYVRQISNGGTQLDIYGESPDGPGSLEVDELIVATGARPDLEMLRELRLNLDSIVESPAALADMIDPNIHSCGTVPPHGETELRQPEPNFYITGMKSYGRAPTFLVLTGYEQVRSITAALAGDWEAAHSVELTLPDTGVCCTDPVTAELLGESASGACCGPTQVQVQTETQATGELLGLGSLPLGTAGIELPVKASAKDSCC
jgi:thioredoxin reductase